MKIAMITTMQHACKPELGWGAEKYIWDITEGLNNLGHEVILFAKEGSRCPKNGILIECTTEKEVVEKYENILRGVDLVHDWSSMKETHDYCCEWFIKSIASNFNVHFLYPTIHKNIVCVSDIHRYLGLAGKSGFEGSQWAQQVGYTGHLKDAKRVYLGINLDDYKAQFEKQDYILFFNSFDQRKGITIALDLAKSLGFKLILAGEVNAHSEHKATFDALKPIMDAMPNVSYECDVSNDRKIELMQNARALLFPSLFHQPFAVVIIEALACGTPVITTNMGCMPELIKHGRTGFLCNSIDELAKSINSINVLSNADCRFDAIKRFDRKIMVQEYIKLYEIVMRGESW